MLRDLRKEKETHRLFQSTESKSGVGVQAGGFSRLIEGDKELPQLRYLKL